MKKGIVILAKIYVKFFELIFSPLTINKNKIVYISCEGNILPKNMRLVQNYIKSNYDSIEEKILAYKFTLSKKDKILYAFEIIKQIYHVKTSKVVVLDTNNFVISNIKKNNNQKIIQLWHATGAIKKFGNDYKRTYETSNYDYIITSSSTSIKRMSSAFGMSEDQIKVLGYPITDLFFDEKKLQFYSKEMIEKYPFVKGKKVIIYAPTFRGQGVYDKKTCDVNYDEISKLLGDEYIFLCKMHPVNEKEKIQEDDNLYNLTKESLYKLFSIADYLVSDFSSVIYDFTILEKPIILFVPDKKNYIDERGTYDDYEEFAPGPIVCKEQELVQAIKNYETELVKVKKLKNIFFDYKDSNSTKRVSKFIIELMNI